VLEGGTVRREFNTRVRVAST